MVYFLKIIIITVISKSRIVGGVVAQPGQHLYVASLQTKQHGHICGAAIISNRWVLSASSCVQSQWPGSFMVRTGTHINNVGGVQHLTDFLLLHPQFDFSSRVNDIALIRTASTIYANAYTAFIPIAPFVAAGYNGVVSGWGHTYVNGFKSTQLISLNTPIIDNESCRTALYNSYGYSIHPTNICALAQYGQGVCRGDSGSPLVVKNELVGIVSFAVGCAIGVPDVYTRVSEYRAWIHYTQAANP